MAPHRIVRVSNGCFFLLERRGADEEQGGTRENEIGVGKLSSTLYNQAGPSPPYWSGWDIARGFAVHYNQAGLPDGGWIMDGWGGLHNFGGAPPEFDYPYWPGWDIARKVVEL